MTTLSAERSRLQDVPGQPRTAVMVLFAVIVGVSFWFIDHNPAASNQFRTMDELSDSENRTADRVEAVNAWSAPFRIGLGIFGLLCVAGGARDGMRRGGAILFVAALYIALLGASSAWSVNPRVSLQKFAVVCCFALAAYGISRRLTLHELAIVFSSICLVYLAVGLLVEVSLGNFTPYRSEYRFIGTSHPNTLAGYGVVCCLAAGVYSRERSGIGPWTVIFFGIGIATLLLTKSRTSMAGLAAALIALRFITLNPHTRLFCVSVGMLAAIAVAMFFTLSRSSARAALAESLAMGRTHEVSSLTGRLPLWEELLDSIDQHLLVGHGYLAYWDKVKIEYLSSLFGWEIPHGHNMYLDVMLDVGIVGLLLFSALLALALFSSLMRYLETRDKGVAFVFGLLVFALVHGFGESLFKMPTFLLFMLVTCILRLDALRPIPSGEQVTQPVSLYAHA